MKPTHLIPPPYSIRTLNLFEAAEFLGAHKETIRRLAASQQLPGVKIGRSWRFIEHDLVLYVHSRYANRVTSQGAMDGSNKQWRFTKEMQFGGLGSRKMDREYNAALGLVTK